MLITETAFDRRLAEQLGGLRQVEQIPNANRGAQVEEVERIVDHAPLSAKRQARSGRRRRRHHELAVRIPEGLPLLRRDFLRGAAERREGVIDVAATEAAVLTLRCR